MPAKKFVFGPVVSRRLGQSLGIDPVPGKTCNFNCVYCQLGRTKSLVHKRREFFPAEEIVGQVEAALAVRPAVAVDWLTFVGAGETCLHSRLGWMIREVRLLSSLPLAVITNGSFLICPEVRRALASADAVLPSLDAGTPELFRRINRAHPEFTFERQVEGLVDFRRSCLGSLQLEVMLVSGLNDSEQALLDLAAAVRRIEPDEVHINVPTRPPAEPWVRPPDHRVVMRALDILGGCATIVPPGTGDFELILGENIVEAVLEIIARHPMSQDELEMSLARWAPERVREALEELEADGRARVVTRLGRRFWSASPSDYPGDDLPLVESSQNPNGVVLV